MQVKSAASKTIAKTQSVFTGDTLTKPPKTTKTISYFVDHPSEWNTTGTVTPTEKVSETSNLLISHSMSTIFDKKVAVRVINATELPYLIKKIRNCRVLRS